MPRFNYSALSDSGATTRGTVEADTQAAAIRILGERRLFPVTIEGDPSDPAVKPRRRIKAADLGAMYSQLADLLGSGVPLLRALDSLGKSTVNPSLKQLLKEIRAAVADGRSLTDTLRQYPETFPVLHTAMIQAGERASFLVDVLRSLSSFIERFEELRSKVMGALIYPALLATLGTLVMVAALLFFVPKFEPLLANAKKPLPSELLFASSRLLRSYWYLILPILGATVAALVTALRSDKHRRTLEAWRLKVPVAGPALRLLAITRFCRILGTMLANGVPLLSALRIAKDATGSDLLADRIAEATDAVRDGKRLSEPLAAGGFIPEQILAMITVAEESNKLHEVLLQIADTVERRTNRQVDQAVRLIEPVILCLVAAAIGFLALGLLLPIFTMASALGSK